MNKILKSSLYIIVAILVGVTAVYAGSTLTAPSAPTKTMHSLSDIYNLIVPEEGYTSTSIYQAPSEVGFTMKTLEEIYTKIEDEIDLMRANNANQILEGNTFFGVVGTATSGPAPVVFATSDITSYQCSWLDENACNINNSNGSGCSWSDSACTGTPIYTNGYNNGSPYLTQYEGAAACANYSEVEYPGVTWRLPTYGELVNHYVDNNNAGSQPTGFQSDNYWSGTTYPSNTGVAYSVGMGDGSAGYGYKSYPSFLVHCAH